MKTALVSPGPASGFRRGLGAACLVVLGLSLAGCASLFGGDNQETLVEPPAPAPELYNRGLAELDAGDTSGAIGTFEEIDQFYPRSEEARRAIVMTAFASYQAGDYDAATDAATRFLALYPNHEDADYALFILGQSYMAQVPDVTRDQDASRRAGGAFQELIERFPDSEYAEEARVNVIAMSDQLAGQEMQVGRYYQERRDYVAAINRFRVVVEDYQNTRHVEEALFRLTETNLAIGLTSEAQTAAAVLGHNFPDSEWYQDAYDLLITAGLQPAENPDSPISQAFN